MRAGKWMMVVLAAAGVVWSTVALAQRGGRGGEGGVRGGGFAGGGAYRGGGYGGGLGGAPHYSPGGGVRSAPAVSSYGGAVSPRAAAAPRSTGTVVGPHGGTVQSGSRSGSYTTQRGTTINYGAAGVGGTGAGGVQGGRYVGGVQVTGSGGQTYSRVGRGGAAVGPQGNAVGGRSSVSAATGPAGSAVGVSRSGTAVGPSGAVSGGYRGGVAVGPQGAVAGGSRAVTAAGPAGTITAGSRGGVAVGPQGAVAGGSRGAVATGPGGTTAGGSRAGVATGPGGTVAAGSRGVVATGPGGTVAAGSRAGVATGQYGTYYATALRTQGAYVRQGFGYYNAFSPGWYARYPGAWLAAGWLAGTAWTAATWGGVSSYCGYTAQPYYYDYGSSVVYQGDTVYVSGEPVGTTEVYSQQAAAIAQAGNAAAAPAQADANAAPDSWLPLGVFAMVQGQESSSFHIFQMAINKQGVIRGNYYNALTDSTTPIYGSADKTSQRAAWTVGDKQTPVYEAGIANLTKDETTMLVHFGEGKSQQFTLVRVEKPEGEASPNGQ
ncbi:MAG: hypothetical protein JO329_11530 [Planctomycetaceae bacterium]|nr:hypothetical protein [Planctomycetaceae bacterium]